MTPPRARTWGRQGNTPVRERGRGSGRVSMTGMTCYKPGERPRLIYAIREYRGRKDEPTGSGWKDYRDLVLRARTQVGGTIVLVRDNVRMYMAAPLREFFQGQYRLAHCAPLTELRPVPPSAGGHLVAGQTRHRQSRSRRPQPDDPRSETQGQDASVPAGSHRWLPGRRGTGPVGVMVRRSRRSESTRWAAERARAAGLARRSSSPAVPQRPRHGRVRPRPG